MKISIMAAVIATILTAAGNASANVVSGSSSSMLRVARGNLIALKHNMENPWPAPDSKKDLVYVCSRIAKAAGHVESAQINEDSAGADDSLLKKLGDDMDFYSASRNGIAECNPVPANHDYDTEAAIVKIKSYINKINAILK